MKIQCDVCERAHATVICCADEAALCSKCDVEFHAANRLASKHQRREIDKNGSFLQTISLNEPLGKKFPQMALQLHGFKSRDTFRVVCFYVQEKSKLIFCVEDRALFCQECDESIHAPGSRSAKHQRFLATGIDVALSSNNLSMVVVEHHSGPPSPSQNAQHVPKTENVSVSASPWGVDELLQLSDFDSSDKKEQIEFGELDWLADMGIFADQLPQEEALAPAEVPQLPASQHQSNYSSSRTTSKFVLLNKKPRIEFLLDEEYFTVPNLG